MSLRAARYTLAALAVAGAVTVRSWWWPVIVHMLAWIVFVAAVVAVTLLLTYPVAFAYHLCRTQSPSAASGRAWRTTRRVVAQVAEAV
ncbi:MAG: hypothetical protein JWO31_3366 [Phycisphaerales bacterium]|nr:hypothetical protein [Phycisphaerales bacterium]